MATLKGQFRRRWFYLPIMGLALTLCGPIHPLLAFTSPGTVDMPEAISVEGRRVLLKDLKNPVTGSDSAFKEGAEVYIKNCVLCHGDLLDGNGLFGKSFFPRPADFLHPESILSKPQSFAYWRIMTGGLGLPKKYKPWNSAMPAWRGVLSEAEVWKVIHYIYTAARERAYAGEPVALEPSVKRGSQVYVEKCALCHGTEGKGDGPAAATSSPRPRNFTKGHIKFRSTPFGKIPTDSDLFGAITHGAPGTTMPAWEHLPASDRHSLVLYLKTLSKKFAKFVKKGKTHKIVTVPEPPDFTLDSLARGKELFVQTCSACHGIRGRSDGASTKKIVSVPTDAIWPRNLTQPWTFRRGNQRKQLFLTLRTGLSLTAMPMLSHRIFKDEQVWDLVHYVQTLAPSQKPAVTPTLKVQKIDGPLPKDPDDPLWKTIDTHFYPLGGQIIQSKKSYHPITSNVVAKAVHNSEEIAFYIHWDDPTADPILKKWTTLKESPPPPLPAHLQVDEPEEETVEEPEPQEFPDSIALQFPVSNGTRPERPYFLNGDAEHPVNLWKWSSHPMEAVEMNATGIEHLSEQNASGQGLSSKAVFRYGRYSLVIKRKLTTPEQQDDVQFVSGQTVPIAFNVWNGTAGETGSQKAISSWFELVLE